MQQLRWNRFAWMMAGALVAAAPAAAQIQAADTKSGAPAKAQKRGAAPDTATLKERFPYRYLGLGGADHGPEFIALTDGSTSFVARVGDVLAERYRISELRATELVLTDLRTRKKGLVLAYKDIQAAPGEAASAQSAAMRSPGAAPAPAVSAARSPRAMPPAREPDLTAADDDEGGDAPAADLSMMIAPPPVNRAEQALPMEMLPPPERNPMIVTPPARDIPMITTPSRREHAPTLDIPLGPQN